MNEQQFQETLQSEAQRFQQEGRTPEEIQQWVDKQWERWNQHQAEQPEENPGQDDAEYQQYAQENEQPTDYATWKESRDAGKEIEHEPEMTPQEKADKEANDKAREEAGIPNWVRGSFVEGLYTTVMHQIPKSFIGTETAITAEDMQWKDREIARLKEKVESGEWAPDKIIGVSDRASTLTMGPGAVPRVRDISVADRIAELEKQSMNDKAGIIDNVVDVQEIDKAASVFENPEIFDEDGMTWEDFKGMTGRQLPQVAFSAMTAGMGAFGQEWGNAYVDNLYAIAQKQGIEDPTPSDLLGIIERGEDEAGVAAATGAVSGALEFVGAQQLVGTVFKSGAGKALVRGTMKEVLGRGAKNIGKGALKNGLVEGLTEGFQGTAQDIGRSYATNTEYEFDAAKTAEEVAQGAVIGALFGGAGGVQQTRAETAMETETEQQQREEQDEAPKQEYKSRINKDGKKVVVDAKDADANLTTEEEKAVDNEMYQELSVLEEIQRKAKEAKAIAEGEKAPEATLPDPENVTEEEVAAQNDPFLYESSQPTALPTQPNQDAKNNIFEYDYAYPTTLEDKAVAKKRQQIAENQARKDDVIQAMSSAELDKVGQSIELANEAREKAQEPGLADRQVEMYQAMAQEYEQAARSIKIDVAKRVPDVSNDIKTIKTAAKAKADYNLDEAQQEEVDTKEAEALNNIKKEIDRVNGGGKITNSMKQAIKNGDLVKTLRDGKFVYVENVTNTEKKREQIRPDALAMVVEQIEDAGGRVRLGPKTGGVATGGNTFPVDTQGRELGGAVEIPGTSFTRVNPETRKQYTPEEIEIAERTQKGRLADRAELGRQTQVAESKVKALSSGQLGRAPLDAIVEGNPQAGYQVMVKDPKSGQMVKFVPPAITGETGAQGLPQAGQEGYAEYLANLGRDVKNMTGYDIEGANPEATRSALEAGRQAARKTDQIQANNSENNFPGLDAAISDYNQIASMLKYAQAARQKAGITEISPQHKDWSNKQRRLRQVVRLDQNIADARQALDNMRTAGVTVDAEGGTANRVSESQIQEAEDNLAALENDLLQALNDVSDIEIPNSMMMSDVNKRNARHKEADYQGALQTYKKELGRKKHKEVTDKDVEKFFNGDITPAEMTERLGFLIINKSALQFDNVINADAVQQANLAVQEKLERMIAKPPKDQSKAAVIRATMGAASNAVKKVRNEFTGLKMNDRDTKLNRSVNAISNTFYNQEGRMPTNEEIAETMLFNGMTGKKGGELVNKKVTDEKAIRQGYYLSVSGKKNKVGVSEVGSYQIRPKYNQAEAAGLSEAQIAKEMSDLVKQIQEVKDKVFANQAVSQSNTVAVGDEQVDILETLADETNSAIHSGFAIKALLPKAEIRAIRDFARRSGNNDASYEDAIFMYFKANPTLDTRKAALAYAASQYDSSGRQGVYASPKETPAGRISAIENAATNIESTFNAIKDLTRQAPNYSETGQYRDGAIVIPSKTAQRMINSLADQLRLMDHNDATNRRAKQFAKNKLTPANVREEQEAFVNSEWATIGDNGTREAINAMGEFLDAAVPGITIRTSNQQFIEDMVNKVKKPNMSRDGFSDATPESRRAWAEHIVDKNLGLKIGGYIWLNETGLSPDARIHEMGHVWYEYLKMIDGDGSMQRALYDKLKGSAYFQAQVDRVKAGYPHFRGESDPRFMEEVVVGAIGVKGADLQFENKTQLNSWKDAVQQMFKKIMDFLGLDFKGKHFNDITADDMLTAIVGDIMQGKAGKKSHLFELKGLRRRWNLFEGKYIKLDPNSQDMAALEKSPKNDQLSTKYHQAPNKDAKKAALNEIKEANENVQEDIKEREDAIKSVTKLLNQRHVYKDQSKYKQSKITAEARNTLEDLKLIFAERSGDMTNDQIVAFGNNVQDIIESAKVQQREARKIYKEMRTDRKGAASRIISQIKAVKDAEYTPANINELAKQNEKFFNRWKNRGTVGIIADLLSPSSNDDFRGLLSRIPNKSNWNQASEVILDQLVDPLDDANTQYLQGKAAITNKYADLVNKVGGETVLAKPTDIKVGRNKITMSQAVMIYNYMKDIRLHKQLRRGGVNTQVMKDVAKLVGGDSKMKAFADGIPQIFADQRSKLNTSLEMHNNETITDTHNPSRSDALGAKINGMSEQDINDGYDIMRDIIGEDVNNVPTVAPYTPMFAKGHNTLDLDKKLEGDSAGNYYTVMSGRLKSRTYGGHVVIDGNNLSNMIDSYVNGPLRTQSYLTFAKNASDFFGGDNMDMLKSYLGSSWDAAMKNSLQRIITGKTPSIGQSKSARRFERYLNLSIGNIMFFNPRSAVLQLVSIPNFAVGNPGEYFSGLGKGLKEAQSEILSSAFMEDRGAGRTDVVTAEMFKDSSGDATKRWIDRMSERGYWLTKKADRFAIAMGGAPYYNARKKAYIKEGLGEQQAKDLAMRDFIAKANEAQQSTNQDRLGQVQTGKLGRYLLAFTNATQQFNRIMSKDLRNMQSGNPGAVAKGLRSISYYSALQYGMFTFLQKAMWNAFSKGEGEKDEADADKWKGFLSGLFDSVSTASGIMGAAVATAVNTIAKAQSLYKDGAWVPGADKKIIMEVLSISPSISTKVRGIAKALGGKIWAQSDGPVEVSEELSRFATGIQAVTGIPTERILRIFEQFNDLGSQDLELSEKILRVLGWSRYDLQKFVDENSSWGEKDWGGNKEWGKKEWGPTKKLSPLAKVTKVVEDESEPGVLGRADKDGTVHLKPGLPAPLKEQVMQHEGKHAEQMKSGKLDYTDKYLIWKGKKYDRKGGKIYYKGKWIQEGSDQFPWEQEAEAAETK